MFTVNINNPHSGQYVLKFSKNNMALNSHAITLVDEINTRIITSDVNRFISLYLNAGLYNFQTNQNFFSDENNNADTNTSTPEYIFGSSDIRCREGYIRTYCPRLVRGANPSSPETQKTCKKYLRKEHQADEYSTIFVIIATSMDK